MYLQIVFLLTKVLLKIFLNLKVLCVLFTRLKYLASRLGCKHRNADCTRDLHRTRWTLNIALTC